MAYNKVYSSHHVVRYLLSTNLSYNQKFVPSDHFDPICPPLTPISGGYRSDYFFSMSLFFSVSLDSTVRACHVHLSLSDCSLLTFVSHLYYPSSSYLVLEFSLPFWTVSVPLIAIFSCHISHFY